MRGRSKFVIDDFTPGYIGNAKMKVPPGAMISGQNIEPSPNGGFKTRLGTRFSETMGTTSAWIWAHDTTYGPICRKVDGALYRLNTNLDGYSAANGATLAAAGTFPALTGSDVASVAVAEGAVVGGQGPVYIIDREYSGGVATFTKKQVTITAAGVLNAVADWTIDTGVAGYSVGTHNATVPSGKWMTYWRNRMWIGGDPSFPNRLWYSDLGNPRSFPLVNYVDIDPDSGGSMTGLTAIGDYLLAFKKSRLYVIYDANTGANRMLSSTIGCRDFTDDGYSAQFIRHDDGAFFLSETGAYWTNGSQLERIDPHMTSRDDPHGYFGRSYLTVFSDFLFIMGDTNYYGSGVATWMFYIPQKSWWPMIFAQSGASTSVVSAAQMVATRVSAEVDSAEGRPQGLIFAVYTNNAGPDQYNAVFWTPIAGTDRLDLHNSYAASSPYDTADQVASGSAETSFEFITATFTTAFSDLGAPGQPKRFRGALVFGSGQVNVYPGANGQEGQNVHTATLGDFSIDETPPAGPTTYEIQWLRKKGFAKIPAGTIWTFDYRSTQQDLGDFVPYESEEKPQNIAETFNMSFRVGTSRGHEVDRIVWVYDPVSRLGRDGGTFDASSLPLT